MKNIGQYDDEYSKCPCFWGMEPAKYVKLATKYLSSGTVLDLGAGEGKNSIYFASLGYMVTAVEVSFYAVRNFIDWLIKNNSEERPIAENIDIICADARKIDELTNKQYDAIVAYGLLHCFKSKEEIGEFVDKMKNKTVKGGINIICTFTDELPIPEIQDYLIPTLLGKNELKDVFYKDWEILDYEYAILEHAHPTSKTMHKHSLCRMISRKK